MFRELARIKQQLSDAECIRILAEEKRGVLSVLGDDGYPYGMPLNHYYDPEDGSLYFHSGMTGHRIDAIRREPKVSFCVIDGGTPDENGWSLIFRSVIVFGRIKIIEDSSRIIEISRKLSHKFTRDDAYIEQEIEKHGAKTLMFALVPEHICGKRVSEK
ncbi:MAG: pyridoxamine 5'-phosphate oxidase family protein [Oscillospiraceae bacterium]|nr:pyridoxamine 5'-phosphate oxidase family protein [Oscillospiraceae bacterium]